MEDKTTTMSYRAILRCIDPAGNPYTITIEESDEKTFYKKLKTARFVGAF